MFTRPLLLDGGLSTALEEGGAKLDTSLWSGELLRSNPEAIRNAHKAYVDAGAKILITSSYQISYEGCRRHGWSDEQTDAALQAATDLARFDGVLVAASVGPYGAMLADGSEYRGNYGLTKEQLKDFHWRRLHVLLHSKPDLLAIETIPDTLEAEAIIELIEESHHSIPYWISFSCKDELMLNNGEYFFRAVELVNKAPHAIGVGINCTAPEFISPLMESAKSHLPFVVYPNSGRKWNADKKEWEGSPARGFSELQIFEWKERGAKVIGGCCGIGPSEIAEMVV
jgi:homocysteine S-methyltransferase